MSGETRTIAYRYGCPSRADLPEAAMEQLRLATSLWNALVAAEKAHQEEVAVLWARHPPVAAALEVLARAAENAGLAADAARQARQEDGTTLPRKSDAARLKEAKRELAPAKKTVREAKNAVIEAGLEPGFAALKDSCRACQSGKTSRPGSLYREFRTLGLGWGTVNEVLARYRVAVAKVAATRLEGKAAELRFHRWDGTGTLAVQVQREASDPVPSPALLASSEGKWRNTARITPWADPAGGAPKGAARHGAARLHVADGLDVEVPLVVHRFLPADAEVKQILLSRTRIAGNARLQVSVAFRTAAPVPRVTGSGVALTLTWRAAGDGWLHAATVASTRPLGEVPHDLKGLIRLSPDRMSADLMFPPSWRAALERDDGIQGYRDKIVNAAREAAAEALKADPRLEELLGRTGAEVSRWQSPGRLAGLVLTWRRLAAEGAASPLALIPPGLFDGAGPVLSCDKRGLHAHDLECWRMRDKHLWTFGSHERNQVLARRKDAYRKAAAWLLDGAQSLALQELDLAGLKRVPGLDREDPERSRRGRGNAHAVAPGELAAAVKEAAKARGVEVVAVKGRNVKGDGNAS